MVDTDLLFGDNVLQNWVARVKSQDLWELDRFWNLKL